ncbi:MAG: UvrD-helicase domain-containing protein, partial [bacterium]|nr:UvrD-helicase domain-containing protein [bacterium]
MSLNPQQLEAVHHPDGPLLLLAGAGSGKTRVIVQRIASLIQEKKIPPHQILAVTFTNKAADEMKERLRGLLPGGIQSLWVSTFHSSCLRILRQHIGELGFKKDFVIYDDNDRMTLIKNCLKEFKIDPKMMHPRAVATAIDGAKNSLIPPEEYPTSDFFQKKIAALYGIYQKELTKNNALDFGDLIMKTVELFKKSSRVLQYYQQLFRTILIDEYQDTNHAQYELVRLLAERHNNLCVVGDDDQSIYGWRGADIRNILEFEKDYPGARVIKLEQNYRSTPEILALATRVIENNRGRKGKTLWTRNEAGEKAVLLTTADERREAQSVVTEIGQLVQQGAKYSDCAIFYRTNAQSRLFEEELNRRKIPYTIFGGIKFYERMEIKDVLAYIRVLINPSDSISLGRIINVPARGIGKKMLMDLESFAAHHNSTLFEAVQRAESIKVASFYRLILEFQDRLKTSGMADLVRDLIDKTGYRAELTGQKTVE